MHDPDHADAVAEGRRLGGHRRKRAATLAAAYELGNIGEVDGIRRIVEIAVEDALALENSIARGRLLFTGAKAAIELLRVTDLEERIVALERRHDIHTAAREPLSGLLGEVRQFPEDEHGVPR